MLIPYSVIKSLLGKQSVRYNCPKCRGPLESALDDAGSTDNCPNCGTSYRVPGSAELNAIKESERLKLAAKERTTRDKAKQQLAKTEERLRKERELDAQEHAKRLEEDQRRAVEVAALAEKRKQAINDAKSRIRKRIESGQRVFLYRSEYIPVDSEIDDRRLADDFHIQILQRLGLEGWEVIQAVPRTEGVSLSNFSLGATTGSTYGGGIGGNVAGVYMILQRELQLSETDDVDEDLLLRMGGPH